MMLRPMLQTPLSAMASALLVSPALAALPPTAQRGKEMAAIAENSDVQSKFNGHPIEAIIYVQPDVYRAKANGCTLHVLIKTIPGQTAPGPRQFRVEAGVLDCSQNP